MSNGSTKKDFMKYLILFITGYCMYIAIEITFRGYSFVWMGIVGAIDFILIDRINDRISWCMDLTLQGLIGSAIITLSELIIGLLDKFYLHLNMWDYSSLPGNFLGIICPQFSFIWILLSIIAIFVADAINYYTLREEPCPHYHLFKWKFSFNKI